jgi:hypothetical protein
MRARGSVGLGLGEVGEVIGIGGLWNRLSQRGGVAAGRWSPDLGANTFLGLDFAGSGKQVSE